MKTLWNALAIFALANVLGFAGFIGWLIKSDRLNADRAREIRAKVSQTITAERAKLDEENAKIAESEKSKEKARKENRPPLTAEEQLAARIEATEIDKQRADRLRKEVQTLQASLTAERAKLDSDRAALEAERSAFQKATGSKISKLEKEQFEKTLGVYTSLKPSQAKTALLELMTAQPGTPDPAAPALPELSAGGSATLGAQPASTSASTPPARVYSEAGTAQAVEFLNAMDDRVRNKIMSEFIKDDPKLAAQLLDRLRVRGKVASASEPAPK